MSDMPLKELKNYRGCAIKAENFDAFWDASLQELTAVQPDLEIIPADYSLSCADCFYLRFTGVGGARLQAKYLRPKTPGRHPTVLAFHGYTYFSGDWSLLVPYAAEGMCVAALDCRGQAGGSTDVGGVSGSTIEAHLMRGVDDPPEKLIFRQHFLDTVELAQIVEKFPEVDSSRMAACGGSQGGGLSLACSALYGNIKLTVCEMPFLSDYRRAWEIRDYLLPDSPYREIGMYFSRHDPLHQREAEVFEKMSYIDLQNFAPKIRNKVIMAVGMQDQICPPSTQFAIYNNLSCEKELYIYHEYGHDSAPGWPDIQLQLLRGV